MPSGPPVAVAAGLYRRFGSVAALRGVDLRVDPGELVLLLGPNGAGKTTLLRCIAGLAVPQRGSVRVLERDVHADPAGRGAIGLLSHQSHLYSDLTAAENLRFAAALHDLPDTGRRVADALARVSLVADADRRVATFSRGMLQRLAVARAMLHEPRLLLLDEPFTGLDTASAAALRRHLVEQRAAGAGIVCVTHEPGEVWDVADRVVVLAAGSVRADLPRPADLAAFRTELSRMLAA